MEFFSAAQHRADRGQDAPASPSRRSLLTASAAVAATPLAGCGTPPPAPVRTLNYGERMDSRFLFYEDPFEHQRQSYRILRNMHDEADVLFWYHFTMFTVVEGRRPEPVVRWEGIEFSHHQKLKDGVYRIHGHNMSFPPRSAQRDLDRQRR